MKTWSAPRDAQGLRFGVVVSRFNHLVSIRLLRGCVRELETRGAASEDIHVAWVPGAFEIPLTARALAATRRYDGIVALGSVIRGGTPHFDYVCRAVTDGVREAMRDTGVPIAFGVLTTDDAEQALSLLKRFGSLTVLNGHIHQIIQKVEGNVAFHTALSTGFPQPAPGAAPAPGPMAVPAEKLRSVLGIRNVSYVQGKEVLATIDQTLAATS